MRDAYYDTATTIDGKDLDVRFHLCGYSPGSPAYTPRGEYAPTEPPEPPEIEFSGIEVRETGGDWRKPTPREYAVCGELWESRDDVYMGAIEAAEEARGPDPDYEYDRRIDDDYCFGKE